jgi:hypothetical protein
MIYEYAIEPEFLLDERAGELLASSIGVPRGRLVSEFPGHWDALVFTAMELTERPVQKARVTEILSRLSKRLLPRKHAWDEDETGEWLAKAEAEHLRRPFRAIVATLNPAGNRSVLRESELKETNALWNVETTCTVNRTVSEFARCSEILLGCAKEVLFVDPHFVADAPRYWRPLQRWLEILSRRDNGVKLLRVEFHTCDAVPAQWIRDQWVPKLEQIVPKGMPFRLIRWQKQLDFHNRYILTNRGGILFLHGLDEGPGTDDLALVGESTFQRRWTDFQKQTACFHFVDEFAINGRK